MKDKALIKAAGLVGYCESANADMLENFTVREAWISGLLEYADNAGKAIIAAYSEPIIVPAEEPKNEQ